MQNTIAINVSAALLAASATALTTATAKNIPIVTPTGMAQPVAGAIFLNAGRWRLSGTVNFIFASTTTGTILSAGPSTTTGTLPTEDAGLTSLTLAFPAGSPTTQSLNLEEVIVDVGAQGANYFLVAQATFAVSTLTAYGILNAIQIAP